MNPPPRQSFAWWCFARSGLTPDELLAGAARAGCTGVEFLDEALWPLARRHGIAPVAIAGHGTLSEGLNRRENAARIRDELLANIATAAAHGVRVLVCFSGDRRGQPDAEGLEICAETLARVAPAAESAGVVLAIELLNSRVDHPDYQCDRSAWGLALCDRVASPAVGLLYDIYYMQIMEGDLVRSIQAGHRHIIHYHTAGNPGRGPLDASQEINYAAVLRAVAATGYTGYVGHEFLPRADSLGELAAACALTREAFSAA